MRPAPMMDDRGWFCYRWYSSISIVVIVIFFFILTTAKH